jgi:F-type H+-transporting ATPase subunit b
MQSLVQNFGIDWKILVSQVFNFLIIFGIVTFLIYKPLAKIVAERRRKIQEGLEKEEEASRRLTEISILESETLKKAESEAVTLISQAERRAKEQEAKILKEADEREREIRKKSFEAIEEVKARSIKEAESELATLAKDILVKIVRVNPQSVDEALLKRMADEVVKSKS